MWSFFERARRTCSFHHDVHSLAKCEVPHMVEPFLHRRRRQIEDAICPEASRKIETARRGADRKNHGGTAHACQGDRAQTDRAGPLDEYRFTGTKRGALDDVDCGQQPAAAADVLIERDRIRKPRDVNAWLEVDGLRPAAQQPLIRRISDAVDTTLGAPRRRAMNRARATAPARSVDVEKHRTIPLPELRAIDAAKRPANGFEDPG